MAAFFFCQRRSIAESDSPYTRANAICQSLCTSRGARGSASQAASASSRGVHRDHARFEASRALFRARSPPSGSPLGLWPHKALVDRPRVDEPTRRLARRAESIGCARDASNPICVVLRDRVSHLLSHVARERKRGVLSAVHPVRVEVANVELHRRLVRGRHDAVRPRALARDVKVDVFSVSVDHFVVRGLESVVERDRADDPSARSSRSPKKFAGLASWRERHANTKSRTRGRVDGSSRRIKDQNRTNENHMGRKTRARHPRRARDTARRHSRTNDERGVELQRVRERYSRGR